MEPTWTKRPELAEKALVLMQASARLSGGLHPITQRSIAELVRSMNSYYSNLIEGNITLPIELERAQKGDYSADAAKRALQMEGINHVRTQRKLEAELYANPSISIYAETFLRRIHFELYDGLTKEHLAIRASDQTVHLDPGKFRTIDVYVANHVAPPADRLSIFLNRIQAVYETEVRGQQGQILAAAAAHHRLLWLHPFLDGNGRVTRLLTELHFVKAGVSSGGLWSLSRGLARNRSKYYAKLASADRQRDNDTDGRGNLSQRALDDFVDYILTLAIDQVDFMSSLLQIDSLLRRIEDYATLLEKRGVVDHTAVLLLREVFLRGEVSRTEVPRILGKPGRTARRTTKAMVEEGLLYSESPLGPLRIRFPAKSTPYLFPALYPAGVV